MTTFRKVFIVRNTEKDGIVRPDIEIKQGFDYAFIHSEDGETCTVEVTASDGDDTDKKVTENDFDREAWRIKGSRNTVSEESDASIPTLTKREKVKKRGLLGL